MREGGDKPPEALLTPFPLLAMGQEGVSSQKLELAESGPVLPSPGDSSEASDSLPCPKVPAVCLQVSEGALDSQTQAGWQPGVVFWLLQQPEGVAGRPC